MKTPTNWQPLAMGTIGAAIGGCVGYFLFLWIARQGFYALMLPGCLTGLGASYLARQRSIPLALICAIAGLLIGVFAEWQWAPFLADGSLTYFVAHLHQLKPITLIMLALGAFFGYRLSLGRS